MRKYCKLHSIAYSTFTSWKRKRTNKDKEAKPKFIRVKMPSAGSLPKVPSLEIKLPNGIGVKMEYKDQVALIQSLMQVDHA